MYAATVRTPRGHGAHDSCVADGARAAAHVKQNVTSVHHSAEGFSEWDVRPPSVRTETLFLRDRRRGLRFRGMAEALNSARLGFHS